MCFSATASFITAAFTGGIGVVALSRSQGAPEAPLAAMPLLFAVQQTIEGGLWLTLPLDTQLPASSLLTNAYLVIALIVWPVFAPVAAYLVEPELLRRRLIAACGIFGTITAAYFLWAQLSHPHGAAIEGGHIVYGFSNGTPAPIGGLYLVATAIALLLSSHRAVQSLGAIVFVGSLIAYFLYREAFVSVWCFFAAAASIVILLHFERAAAARRSALSKS